METADSIREQIIDEEHLRLLTLGDYIAGSSHIAFASFFIFHFVFMLVAAFNPNIFGPAHQTQSGPTPTFFKLFAFLVGVFILLGWSFGALTIYAGRCIKARERRTLCLVVAFLNTLAMPIGTIIGVCTLMVLSRSSVKRLYGL